MKNIKICFEYHLANENIYFLDDLIDKDKLEYFNQLLLKYSKEWYITYIDKTLYKDISIGQAINFDFRANCALELKILFVLFSHENLSKNLEFHVSKEYDIKNDILLFLDVLSISYTVVRKNEVVPVIVNLYNVVHKESYLKRTFRNILAFSNNILKEKAKKRAFFQGYGSTKKLISLFDNEFVTDQLFPNIDYIFSRKSPLYFNPSLPFDSKIDNCSHQQNISDQTIESCLEYLVVNFYNKILSDIKKLIDYIEEIFSKLNIKDTVLMCEIPMVSSIISQLIHKNNGKVYLLNHGLRDFGTEAIMHNFDDIDGVFCWSEYEYNFFNSKGVHCVKCGYPIFREIEIIKNDNIQINKKSKICILPDLHFEYWNFNQKKSLEDLLFLVSELTAHGYDRNNISIKIHPGLMNIDFFELLFNDILPKENILKDKSITTVIKEHDLIIGPFSTAIYETIFLGKPYVVYSSYSEFFEENIIRDIGFEIFNSTTIDQLIKYLDNFYYEEFDTLKKKLLYDNSYAEVNKIISNEFKD